MGDCVAVLGRSYRVFDSDEFELEGEMVDMLIMSKLSETGELGNDPRVDVGEPIDEGEPNEVELEKVLLVSIGVVFETDWSIFIV